MGSVAPGVLAFIIGLILAVAGFVPWVAIQYRRHATLRAGPAVLAFGILVYALAVMAYTLLPLPADTASMCRDGGTPPQTRLFASWTEIQRHGGYSGPASLLNNWAIAQVLLNVLLFVPLGMFVRHAVRNTGAITGVAVATVAGLGLSLLVECTQLSGIWSLYPCAYRLFDVDDLVVNTVGASLGAMLGPLLSPFSARRARGRGTARPVTAGRRLAGMLCDVLVLGMASGAVVIVIDLISLAAGGDGRASESDAARYALVLVPPLGQLASVLVTGRTAGEIVVRLRPVSRPAAGRALTRWALGIGGWSLMSESILLTVPAYALALIAVVSVWTTRGHRGFAYASAGLDIRDAGPTSHSRAR